MNDSFTVRAGELAAGGKSLTGLSGAGEKIGTDVVQGISGMGEAASGHAGLGGALAAAAEQSMKTFLDISAACDYTSMSLSATAATYGRAEAGNAAKARAIGKGAR